MKTERTQGPWRVEERQSPGSSAKGLHVIGHDNNDIAFVRTHMAHRRLGAPMQELPYEANAHLIAAAPELLEALEELNDIVFRNGLAHSNKASRALKKAKGE